MTALGWSDVVSILIQRPAGSSALKASPFMYRMSPSWITSSLPSPAADMSMSIRARESSPVTNSPLPDMSAPSGAADEPSNPIS